MPAPPKMLTRFQGTRASTWLTGTPGILLQFRQVQRPAQRTPVVSGGSGLRRQENHHRRQSSDAAPGGVRRSKRLIDRVPDSPPSALVRILVPTRSDGTLGDVDGFERCSHGQGQSGSGEPLPRRERRKALLVFLSSLERWSRTEEGLLTPSPTFANDAQPPTGQRRLNLSLVTATRHAPKSSIKGRARRPESGRQPSPARRYRRIDVDADKLRGEHKTSLGTR